MLVLLTDWLDEADRLERTVARGLDELRLVAQVGGAGRGSRPVVDEIVERLVVELEVHVGAEGPDRGRMAVGVGTGTDAVGAAVAVGPARAADVAVGIGPAARIPGP